MDKKLIDLLSNPTPEVIEILTNAKALSKVPNECGHTALHLVTRYEATTPEVIHTLIEAGPKIGVTVNAPDIAGCTALHFAARKNPDPEVIEALLNTGAEVNAQDKYGGWTAMHFAAKENTNPEIIKALLNVEAAMVDPQDKRDMTPLHWAAWQNANPKVTEALLNAGAQVEAEDQARKTPWDYAQENTNLKGTKVYWRLDEARFK